MTLLALAAPARADEPPHRTPFDRGRFAASIGAGTQTNFDTQYFWAGAGVGYFLLDGLEVGLSGLHEFGSGPSISIVSPSLRYVAQPLVGAWPVVPYVGTFYDHWFIGSGNPDVDAIGARAGFLYVTSAGAGSAVLGLGIAVEHQLGACGTTCNSVYPDITISFAL